MSVSIRAPVKGAIEAGEFGPFALRRFNPRPREGGDRTVDANRLEERLFQSAPP